MLKVDRMLELAGTVSIHSGYSSADFERRKIERGKGRK